MLEHLLKHATPEHAVQLYAVVDLKQFGASRPVRVTTQAEVDAFCKANEGKHLFFNTALMAKVDKGRGGDDDARLLPWLFADIDTKDGNHSDKSLPSKKEVADMLTSGEVVQKPSIANDSGGGLHVYWLLDMPVTDMVAAKKALVGINEKIAKWMLDKGYGYKKLADLCRVLRIPGYVNAKYGDRVVKQELPKNGKKPDVYRLSDFDYQPEPTLPEFEPVEIDETKSLAIANAAMAKIPADWGEDGSGYLVRLARQCVRAGVSAKVAVLAIKSVLATHEDYPTKWTDEQIIARYEDAKGQSTLGEAVQPTLPKDEYELAEYMAEKAEKQLCYLKKWKVWAWWDGEKYDTDSLSPVYDHIAKNAQSLMGERDDKQWVNFLARYRTLRGLNDMEKLLKNKLEVHHSKFDADQMRFFCKNGCLTFTESGTVSLSPHRAENMNMKMSPVVYDPSAKCPRWEQFIKEVCVNEDGTFCPELAKYLQVLSGYCLTGRCDLQYLWIFHGGGRNGKGAFVRTMQALLGPYAVTMNQETFTGDNPYGLVKLFGSRAAFASETDQDCRLSEHKVKNLTGGDKVVARDLYQSFWEFSPTHKLFLSTNHIPNIRGTDNGIWRRIKLVPFNATVEQDESMEPMLLTELSGILNWAIEGYLRLQMFGLVEPEIMKQCIQDYRDECDIVRQFVEAECDVVPDGSASRAELSVRLAYFCRTLGTFQPSPRKFYTDLRRMGIKERKSNGERFFTGIRLKTDFSSEVF